LQRILHPFCIFLLIKFNTWWIVFSLPAGNTNQQNQ